MALINCCECKAEISDQAAACPKCGFELPKTKTRNTLVTVVVIGVVLVALFFSMDAMFSKNKKEMADFNQSLDRVHNAANNAARLNNR